MILLVLAAGLSSVFTAGWMHWHAAQEVKARAAANCQHPDELQETMRVSNIITMNPWLLHAIIPGRRHLTKRCRGCGEQTMKYVPQTQAYDDFVREFDQETIDRARQFQARTQAWIYEKAQAEKIRLARRG